MTSSHDARTPLDIGEEYPGYGCPVGPTLRPYDFSRSPDLPIEKDSESLFSSAPQIKMPDFASMVIDLTPSIPSLAPYNNPNPGDLVGRQPNSLL